MPVDFRGVSVSWTVSFRSLPVILLWLCQFSTFGSLNDVCSTSSCHDVVTKDEFKIIYHCATFKIIRDQPNATSADGSLSVRLFGKQKQMARNTCQPLHVNEASIFQTLHVNGVITFRDIWRWF